MYRPNSIKTLISMKREKEEALTKSLCPYENEDNLENDNNEDESLDILANSGSEKEFSLPNLDQAKDLLNAVNETLQNLRTWKKAEKLDFEKKIHENEQKILISNENQQENEDSLQKYVLEIEEMQKKCANQIEAFSHKLDKDEMGFFLKVYEESFKKIKDTNEKLESIINKHQNFYGNNYENDIQRQFFKTAIESLNLDKLNNNLEKWHNNIEDFYHKKENSEAQPGIDLKNMKTIKIEEIKVQEQALEDMKISQKIKNEIDEIDKELEELEKILS